MSCLPKVLITILTWLIFILAVWQIPYPRSLTSAGLFQILAFFIPLLLALTATINLFLKSTVSAFILSVGIISGLFLKALDSFNVVTVALIVVAEYLLLSYKGSKGLTKDKGMPKLRSLRRRK